MVEGRRSHQGDKRGFYLEYRGHEWDALGSQDLVEVPRRAFVAVHHHDVPAVHPLLVVLILGLETELLLCRGTFRALTHGVVTNADVELQHRAKLAQWHPLVPELLLVSRHGKTHRDMIRCSGVVSQVAQAFLMATAEQPRRHHTKVGADIATPKEPCLLVHKWLLLIINVVCVLAPAQRDQYVAESVRLRSAEHRYELAKGLQRKLAHIKAV